VDGAIVRSVFEAGGRAFCLQNGWSRHFSGRPRRTGPSAVWFEATKVPRPKTLILQAPEWWQERLVTLTNLQSDWQLTSANTGRVMDVSGKAGCILFKPAERDKLPG
jgi:hypothetical protein